MTTKIMLTRAAVLAVILVAAALFCAKIPVASGQTPASTLPINFQEIKAVYDGITDYRCVFSKTELLDGRMKTEKMEMLFRKPHDIKFIWMTPKKGQKAVYLKGRNGDKLRARKGGMLGLIAVNLDPTGDRAMDDNRHPITQGGIGFLIEKTLEDIAKGQYELKYVGDEDLQGRPCYHLEFDSQGARGYHYGLKTEFWIDKELKLPIQSKHFDYDNRWIETYSYTQLKLNVGLRDNDFEI